ncbi:MAG: GPW/gp25 family protein [Cyanobacteriota bacterium]
MRLAFPFTATPLGQATAWPYGSARHVRDCLELLILTGPGERVMRPAFGSQAREMLFASGNGPAAVALEAALQATVTQELGHLLDLINLQVDNDEAAAALLISLTYAVKATGQTDTLSLRTGVP